MIRNEQWHVARSVAKKEEAKMKKRSATEVRQGAIGHGVRYVLATSLALAVIALFGVGLFF